MRKNYLGVQGGIHWICTALMIVFLSMPVKSISRDGYRWRRLNGPWGGTVSALCLDPANSLHLIAATPGGIFHSYNGAISWIPLGEVVEEYTAFSHLRYDMSHLGTLYMTGTDAYSGECGIYRSSDSGVTWEYLNLSGQLNDIWITDYPNRLLAGGEWGLFISEDNGVSWWPYHSDRKFYEFISHPEDPDRIYAAVDDYMIGISDDGGVTWRFSKSYNNTCTLPDRTSSARGISISNSPPYRIFTCRRFNDTGQVAVTDDEGGTWRIVLEAPINRVKTTLSEPEVVWAVGGINHFDPNQDTVMFKSYDNGETWLDISAKNNGMAFDICIDPENPQKIYIGRLIKGVLATDTGGSQWIKSNRYMSASDVYTLALNPIDENTLLAADRYQGLVMTDRNGRDWRRVSNLEPSYLVQAAYHPDDPDIILAGTNVLFRSNDGGKTWEDVGMTGSALTSSIAFSPAYPDYAFAARCINTDAWGFYVSTNAGQNWWKREFTNTVMVCPDPFHAETVFVKQRTNTVTIFKKSEDLGATWTQIPDIYIGSDMAYDPTHADRFYLNELYSKIVRTDDGGDSWVTGLGSEIQGSVNTINISPLSGDVFCGANGFYFSQDTGETWTRETTGLFEGSVTIVRSRFELMQEAVYLGMDEGGIWKWMPEDNETPEIELIYPDGEATFEQGNVVRIRWDAQDNEGILYCDIFLSADSGETWPYVVAGAVLEDGCYDWHIPYVNSESCRLKIIAYDYSWNWSADAGSTDFTIIAPTPTPSPFPTMTPTITPIPTVTPLRLFPQIRLNMPEHRFYAGDKCFLRATIDNPSKDIPNAAVFIILDIYGQYWFAPSWISSSNGFDHFKYTIPTGITEMIIIPEFVWPDHTGSGENLQFLGFILDPSLARLYSNI
ncbi:hypothetical protein JW979_09705, partial [bacterium]|nr:hypothetical protein [candidate division CSSED10-310 bacterium]